MTRAIVGGGAVAPLLLRIKLADRDAELGARLQHPRSGAEQGEVLVVGRLDQAIEHGIVKHLPPVAIVLPVRPHGGVVRFEVFFSDGRDGRREIRPDRAARERRRQMTAIDGERAARHPAASRILADEGQARRHCTIPRVTAGRRANGFNHWTEARS